LSLIFKSLGMFIALVLLYSVFVKVVPVDKVEPINQRQANIISTQEFVFNKSRSVENIIVGSSLAFRMNNNLLPDNYWNLSVGGGSSLRGLELLELSSITPKVILIETNILDRESTQLEEVIHPVDNYVKRYIPITQEKYTPVTYGINMIYQMLKSESSETAPSVPKSSKAQKVMIDLQKEKFDVDVSQDSLTINNFKRLEKLVTYFHEKGSCVVFFEMPITCELAELPKSISIRNLMSKYFPANQYKYIPKFNCSDFNTTDGIHLDSKGAKKMLNNIITELQKLNCK